MKFICSRQALSEAISSVSRAVSQKSSITALEGIKVSVEPGKVTLTGYNLEIGMTTSIDAQTEDTGEFVVSTRLFSEFTRKMTNDEVTFDIDNGHIINISSGSTECSFSGISAEEYPDLPEVDALKSFSVKASTLKSMINMTSYAASMNETKPVLTGELFDIENGKFNLVAMDGFRLAIRCENASTNDTFRFVVPKDDDEAECMICTNDRHIIFQVGRVYVIARLLEGSFHNYKLSIPSECKTEVIVNKRLLAASLDRCSLIIDEKNKAPLRCEVGNGVIRIACKTGIGKVNDAIPADISGEAVTIGFNNRLMLEAVRAAEGDTVRIRFNGAMKVIEMLPPEGEDYIFLVMPIKLKD